MKTFYLGSVLLICTSLTCGKIGDPPSLFQYQNCWSSIGAVGIVDETSRDQIIFGQPPDPDVTTSENGIIFPNTTVLDGTITLDNRSPAGQYQIRYPLNQQFIFRSIRGEDNFRYPVFLQAKYKVRDHQKERILIQLKRVQIEPYINQEVSQVLLEIDSGEFSANDQFQHYSAFDASLLIDFSRYAYYIDVQLINKGADDFSTSTARKSISPAIAFLQICEGGGPAID